MNAGDDFNALAAQVRDLRAEVERVTRERDESRLGHARFFHLMCSDETRRKEAEAEVARLRAGRACDLAEVARLRAALELIVGEATTPLAHAVMQMRDEARRALRQEQP